MSKYKEFYLSIKDNAAFVLRKPWIRFPLMVLIGGTAILVSAIITIAIFVIALLIIGPFYWFISKIIDMVNTLTSSISKYPQNREIEMQYKDIYEIALNGKIKKKYRDIYKITLPIIAKNSHSKKEKSKYRNLLDDFYTHPNFSNTLLTYPSCNISRDNLMEILNQIDRCLQQGFYYKIDYTYYNVDHAAITREGGPIHGEAQHEYIPSYSNDIYDQGEVRTYYPIIGYENIVVHPAWTEEIIESLRIRSIAPAMKPFFIQTLDDVSELMNDNYK